eukprot:7828056-Lingulodinium_polyedra.AAC.1
MALICNEATSDWATARKLKERFEFAILMKRAGPGSARQGAAADQIVRSDQMMEKYHVWSTP